MQGAFARSHGPGCVFSVLTCDIVRLRASVTVLLRSSESHVHSRRTLRRSGTTCGTALHTQVDRFNEIVLGKNTAPSRAGSPSMMAGDDTTGKTECDLTVGHLAAQILGPQPAARAEAPVLPTLGPRSGLLLDPWRPRHLPPCICAPLPTGCTSGISLLHGTVLAWSVSQDSRLLT